MFIVSDSIQIAAPIERVFLLSCSVAIVERELGMHPVLERGGTRTEGLVVGGDRIRWEGWQLGFPNYHVSLISAYGPYTYFQDRMVAGRFRMFEHDHRFEQQGGLVLMQDAVRFSMPLGFAGRLVGKAVMMPHIAGLLRRRFARLKRIAESEEWRAYLPNDN